MQNKQFEKIELYLNHELSDEEAKLFEEQLKNDQQLSEQLALYKNMDEEMRQKMAGSEDEEKLKQTLSGLNEKYFEQPGRRAKVTRLHPHRRRLFAAAAVFLLIATGLYWYFYAGNKGSETLYAQYAIYQPLSLQRDSKSVSKTLQDAIVAYNARKFEEALRGLGEWVKTDSSDAGLLLAQNICLTETGRYEEAIDGFNKLAAKNEIFKSQAVWYKALAYLKQNKTAECRETLESIPPGADSYKKAQDLLRQL